MIVDAEVHILHPEAIEPDFAKNTKESVRASIHEHPDFNLLLGKMTIGSLLNSMHNNSISHALIMGMPWDDSRILNENNTYIEECVRNYPSTFKGLYIPDLKDINKAVAKIEQLDQDVFLGAKIIPSWQDVRIDNDKLKPIIETIIEKDMFLMVHTDHLFQSLDKDVPYRLYQLVLRHPRLKVLAPHLGGLLCLYAGLPHIKKAIKKVHFITSVSATMYMVEFASKMVPDNLIFGTDFPFNHCHDQETPIESMSSLNIPDSLKKDILGLKAQIMFNFRSV